MPKTRALRPPADRLRRKKDVPVIGWREWIALPEFGIEAVKAKIDTGARTSAIHAFRIRPFIDAGSPWVSFVLRPQQRRRNPSVECTAPVVDERKIRSSNGQQELRFVIRVAARLGETQWPIEMSLANRGELGFRMLLGREAVRRHFLIDPGQSYLVGRSFADVSTKPKPRTKP